METDVFVQVKEEAVFEDSIPVPGAKEGVVSPVSVAEEGVVPPVTVSEEGVVNLWRAIGSAKGFSTDTDLAKFLMTLYMNYDDPGPEGGSSRDATAGRQQTGDQTDNQTVVHVSQEVSTQTNNQADRPSSHEGETQTDWASFGEEETQADRPSSSESKTQTDRLSCRKVKTQTDAECSKCNHPLALVCINHRCQGSPVVALKKSQPSALSPAEPSDAGPLAGSGSGDDMDVEDFSGFEAESSAEDSDLDTKGRPALAKQPVAISKKKAPSKEKVDNSLQPIVKLHRSDCPKDAARRTAKADHSASGSRRTEDKSRKLKSNVSVKSSAEPMQKLEEVLPEAEIRKRTTTDRSVEDGRVQKLEEVRPEAESRKRTTTDRSVEDGRVQKLEEVLPEAESRKRTTTDRSVEDGREKRDPTDAATEATEPDGCSDRKKRAYTKKPVSVARRSTRSSGPLELEEVPAEEPVTTATGKYPIVDGVAYKSGKIPGLFFSFTEFKCSRCDKTFDGRGGINRHIKNPSCDDGNDDLFKQFNYWKKKGSYKPVDQSDEEWNPESAAAEGEEEKIIIPRRHPFYRSQKGVTLQDFMTGKVPVPISYYGKRFDRKNRERKDQWYFSHYTCLKCYTVFEMKRTQFLIHKEECDGTRDADRIASGSGHQGVQGQHATLELEDADMAPADSQTTDDLAKTTGDSQLTQDAAKTNVDGQLTQDVAKTTADGQVTQDVAKTTADGQLTKDATKTTADGQLTKDVAKTTANSQLTKNAAKTNADGQLTKDVAKTTANSQLTKNAAKTNADGQLTKDAAKTTADGQLTKDAAKTTADGQLTKDAAETTADSRLTKDAAKTTADGQLTKDAAKTTADSQLTEDSADDCETGQPSSPHPGGEDRQLDAKSIEILMRVKERYLFCCPHCDLVYFNKTQHRMHVLSHFYTRKASDGSFTCQICDETRESLLFMQRHLQIPKKRNSQCEECGVIFAFKCQIYPHTRMHSKEATKLRDQDRAKAKALQLPDPYKRSSVLCAMCGKVCGNPRALQTHLQSHSDEKPYECSVCGVALKTEASLKVHEAAHNGPQFQCEDCGRAFYSPSALKAHKNLKHAEQRPRFPCQYCGKELSRKPNLEAHIKRVHFKVKPYACELCEYQANGKSDLNKHKVLHSGEKPFRCDICLKRFARVDYLERHARYHTGERPYACDDCKQCFVCITSLKQHRRKHHSDKLFSCNVCNTQFSTTVSLNFHKYKEHGVAKPVPLNRRQSRKQFPCDLCNKVLYTPEGLDFHHRKHQESDQKSSEHQDSHQESLEHRDSVQKSSEHESSDQKSLEHQDSDQKSSEENPVANISCPASAAEANEYGMQVVMSDYDTGEVPSTSHILI